MMQRMMTKVIAPFLLLATLLGTSLHALDNDDYRRSILMFSSSAELQSYFRNAYGYAVFPRVVKGGFIGGAAYGSGRVYRRHRYVGSCTMYQLSVGAQLGAQLYREIIFFKNRDAFESFTSGDFEGDATASAVLLSFAAHAKIGTTGHSAGVSTIRPRTEQFADGYINGMAAFVHVRGGAMYEAALSGQHFGFTPR